MIKLVNKTKEHIHTDDFTICVDNGYWNPEQLKEILKTNTMVVIPDNADAQRKKKKIQQKIRSGKRQEILDNQRKTKNKRKNKLKRLKKH